MNLESAVTEEMLDFACRIRPQDVCLVPEKRQELTTEGGLDVLRAGPELGEAVKRLAGAGIRTSLFVEADAAPIERAAALGAACVELHTGLYADAAPADRGPILAIAIPAEDVHGNGFCIPECLGPEPDLPLPGLVSEHVV